jgi:hypothetical protein
VVLLANVETGHNQRCVPFFLILVDERYFMTRVYMAVMYAQTRSGLRIVMNTGDYVTIGEAGKSTLFRLTGTRGTIDFYAWESRHRIQLRGETAVGKFYLT